MRVQEGHTPHASWSFGERQFKARATSSANSFLPTPSSPENSIAPGRRSETSIRFRTVFTLVWPVSSSNIIHFRLPIADCQFFTNRQLAIGNRQLRCDPCSVSTEQ